MPPRSTLATGLVVLTLAVTTGLSADQNWPRFRGANAGAIANDPSLPDTWSATQNVAWKVDIPGIGWGSPVVWGDHVFVTSAVNTGAPEPIKSADAGK